MIFEIPSELLTAMLLQEHEIHKAPEKIEHFVPYKEIIIPIGEDHSARLTLDEMSFKELENMVGFSIKEEEFEG